MEGCATGILIEIDIEDSEECTSTNGSVLLEWEKDLTKGVDMTLKKHKTKCLLEEKNFSDHMVDSMLLELNDHPFRTNSNVPLVGEKVDKSSRNKEKPNEDLWRNIVDCDGYLLLENEKFDFSISLSDDTSRTDDDVYYTQSVTGERKAKTAMQNQVTKDTRDKQTCRNLAQDNDFQEDVQNSLSTKVASVSLTAKFNESNKENGVLTTPKGSTLVRQNTFTLSTSDDSSVASKSQEGKTNCDDMQNINIKNSKSNVLVLVQGEKSLRKTTEIRRNSVEKQTKPTRAGSISKKLSSKNTRPTIAKRPLKESQVRNTSILENQTTKKSSAMCPSKCLTLNNSYKCDLQSQIKGIKNSNFTANRKCIKQPEIKRIAPVKATLPVQQMTKSQLRLPLTYKGSSNAKPKITKGSNLSKTPHCLQLITSSDSSLSFTPQRRSLNISSVPTLTSTPNRRSASNSSMPGTPSIGPFAKTTGLPTPIRLLNSSDIKI